MRIVLDTNVIVSGIINPDGAPGRLVGAVVHGKVTALYDDRIVREYRDVLYRPRFHFTVTYVNLVLDAMERNGEYVSAGPLSVTLPDETDTPFLEVAVASNADALVTGNLRDFKPRRGRHQVRVISPADFARQLTQ